MHILKLSTAENNGLVGPEPAMIPQAQVSTHLVLELWNVPHSQAYSGLTAPAAASTAILGAKSQLFWVAAWSHLTLAKSFKQQKENTVFPRLQTILQHLSEIA